VVSLDLGAAPDFVINGRTGYRVSPDNVEELAGRLIELLSDPVRCEEMGRVGQALVEHRYTWAKTQNDILNQMLIRL